MAKRKLPHLIYRHGVWHVVKDIPFHDFWAVESEGKTPAEALDNYYGSFESIVAESERVVMAEFLRIGKKALPVILALVAGFLIGRLYG